MAISRMHYAPMSSTSGLNQKIDLSGGLFIRPGQTDGSLAKFVSEARDFAGGTTGIERAIKLTEFVNRTIAYDAETRYDSLDLGQVLAQRSGVCRHQSAALQFLLEEGGYDVKYTNGWITIGRLDVIGHAWLRVKIDGIDYLADPTNNVFKKYADCEVSVWSIPIVVALARFHGPFGLLREISFNVKESNFIERWDWKNLLGLSDADVAALNSMEEQLQPFVHDVEQHKARVRDLVRRGSKAKLREVSTGNDAYFVSALALMKKSTELGQELYAQIRAGKGQPGLTDSRTTAL